MRLLKRFFSPPGIFVLINAEAAEIAEQLKADLSGTFYSVRMYEIRLSEKFSLSTYLKIRYLLFKNSLVLGIVGKTLSPWDKKAFYIVTADEAASLATDEHRLAQMERSDWDRTYKTRQDCSHGTVLPCSYNSQRQHSAATTEVTAHTKAILEKLSARINSKDNV